jgi:formylglycine-generating enzyme required for sulfatase activity
MQGGNFLMGRSDISSLDPVKSIQYPAHQVSVGTFYIDATEVTNAEYAEFVRATGHEPPRGWGGSAPPAGKETWPVTHVSYADALQFAAWRSRRDAVTYRLPTEEEWEFAARGGGSQLYPWGNNWVANRANLDAASPKPVGSFPSGMTPQGVQDLIGNVWEWTSSRARIYPGNEDAEVGSGEQNYMVTRGGAYVSKSSGNEAITAASRVFAAPTTTHETLGFRLVREGS